MDVFRLREKLVDDYRRYAESFLLVKDERLSGHLREELDSGLLWPDPPAQLNPAFAASASIDELVAEGVLHDECRRIFRVDKADGTPDQGRPMRLHRHQTDAIREAQAERNYVLTTGTGSGKSLAYIVPAVDHALRSGAGDGRLKALIVYPMNALANSQLGELEKFLCHGYPDGPPVTFGRYTGQEDDEQRRQIQAHTPDILLTNYVMLEYILTRPDDRRLITRATDLRYLVLDELHTYRGRQGADVGMLTRRVRDACGSDALRIVGTSATLAGPGSFASQREEVAKVASRIFGVAVSPESVIGETLEAATEDADLEAEEFKRGLAERIRDGRVPDTAEEFAADPVARWTERTLGIRVSSEEGRLERCDPMPISGPGGAAQKLAEATGLEVGDCEKALRETLLSGSQIEREDVPYPIFAFRLHQFLSGGATLWASLDSEAERHISTSGQQFVPGRQSEVLLPLCFCRECGQEYYCVWETGSGTFLPREISERAGGDGERDGFIYLSTRRPWPEDMEEVLGRLPAEWLDPDSRTVKRSRRKSLPEPIAVDRGGARDPNGCEGVFISAPFRFCLSCGVAYGARLQSDFTKLAGLGAGGRSTSTDVLALSALDHLEAEGGLKQSRRKVLSFTDNRQDASLQAGHFNDFVEVGLLRSALYRAAAAAGERGLGYTEVAPEVLAQSGLTARDYAKNPELKGGGVARRDAAMHEVISYRIYADQARWRLTSPNLELTGLIEIGYDHLDECAADQAQFCAPLPDWVISEDGSRDPHRALEGASPATRAAVMRVLLDFMRRELAISSDQLNRQHQATMAANSRQYLVDPWLIEESDEHSLSFASVLYPRPRRKDSDSRSAVFLSPRGSFGGYLRRPGSFPHLSRQLTLDETGAVIAGLLSALQAYGLVEVAAPPEEADDVPGFQLQASELRWRAGSGERAFRDELRVPEESSAGSKTNQFFVELYRNLAGSRGAAMQAREHTAQVPPEVRAEREDEFRSGELPLLFCSPTMELGVDIADLNVVNLRNVPPTPANYAQRSGRAGRSGDPALVYTFCSSWSNHDSYFFRRSREMVSGKVSPPSLDLANEDLLRAHVQAIWLAETGAKLGSSMTAVLDTDGDEPTLELRPQLAEQLRDRGAERRARERAATILEGLGEELTNAGWYDDGWLQRKFGNACESLDRACDRWRGLFRAAQTALEANHRVNKDASASSRAKRDAKRLYREAQSQLDLLRGVGAGSFQADFYPYRYLAGEGFLPGYNFPRLPLSAFIPARRPRGDNDDFLSRPRFLAIREFGPGSIIYYEGSRYRVSRVMLPAGDESGLPLGRVKTCANCGYLHEILESDGVDLCERCGTELLRVTSDLFRLQNVTTHRQDRISSNEEERQRQGYEIRTSVRFDSGATAGGRVKDAKGELAAKLEYGAAATIWRINLGWSRRADRAIEGFGLDTRSGRWEKDTRLAEAEAQGDEPEKTSGTYLKRVIPYVEDRRNALFFDPRQLVGDNAMATLEAALKQGIQAVFQLEDGELASEPLPESGDRQLILFYEASEGGAGALRQLLESGKLTAVAKKALEICHFDPDSGEDLGDQLPREPCEVACYDCLLNYSNQRDHRAIDRHLVRDFLFALAGSSVEADTDTTAPLEHAETLKAACDSGLERDFVDLLLAQRRRLPTHAQLLVEAERARPDFTYVGQHMPVAVFVDGPHHEDSFVAARDAEARERLEDAGYQVIAFPHDADWTEILDRHRSVFGHPAGAG